MTQNKPNLHIVGDSESDTKQKKLTESDVAALFTPDAGFDMRVSELPKPVLPTNSVGFTSPLPELDLPNFQVPPPSIQSVSKSTQTKVLNALGGDFPEINYDVFDTGSHSQDSTHSSSSQESPYISTLEKERGYYAQRFQEILKNSCEDTPENRVKKYAKILLYIMEQFRLHCDKSKQYKFMAFLKSILSDEPTFSQETYMKSMENRSYILPLGEMKEEIELLYNIYYHNYSLAQREYKNECKKADAQRRMKLQAKIDSLAQEMGNLFDTTTPSQQPETHENIGAELRDKIRGKRAQRESK